MIKHFFEWRSALRTWPVWCSLALSFGFSVWVLLNYLEFPLAEPFVFRQAQTAISAFWMEQHFSLFYYETPVLGMPWSIPFEFPTYQTLVVLFRKLCPAVTLDAAARIVSWIMWAACAYPLYRIMFRYFRDVLAPCILLCLFFSSPFSVYWARNVMIESTALFFSLMFLWNIILLGDRPEWRTSVLATIWGVLAILTKVTTIPPFMLAGGLHILFVQQKSILNVWKQLAMPFMMSVFFLLLWTWHADTIKGTHLVANLLTSKNLSEWNFGTMEQKMDLGNWITLLSRNIRELYGNIYIFFASCGLIFLCKKRYVLYALSALFLFMVPMMIFTNLYFIHSYYQMGNMIFILASTAILLYGAACRLPKNYSLYPVLVLVLVCILHFQPIYGHTFPYALTSPPFVVGRTLNMLTSPDDCVVVFGDDWSSATQYYAQRRGLSYSLYIERYQQFAQSLDNIPLRLGKKPSAIVVYDQPVVDSNPLNTVTLEQTGAIFSDILSEMRKVRVANATVYYSDNNIPSVSLLDGQIKGIAPQTTVNHNNGVLTVTAGNEDPYFSVPVSPRPDKRYFLRLRIDGPDNTVQVYYLGSGNEQYAEEHSIKWKPDPALDALIELPADFKGPTLRIDPGGRAGTYTISELSLIEVAK